MRSVLVHARSVASLAATDILASSVNAIEVKKILRHNAIGYRESHACLAVSLPKPLLIGSRTPAALDALDSATSNVFINKTTGEFACPEMGLAGSWEQLKGFFTPYKAYRSRKKGEAPTVMPDLPAIDLTTDSKVADLWMSCVPIEFLDLKEFTEVLRLFSLSTDFRREDFVRFEARVNKDLSELVFPVRYMHDASSLIGLRKVSADGEASGGITEENVTGSTSSELGHLPFPHGLDVAASAKAKSVVLVTSVLDSVAVASRCKSVSPVALAKGSNFLPPKHLPYFEGFEKIFLWFPNDGPSVERARAFAKKLGETRCYLMPKRIKSPAVCLVEKENIAEALNSYAKLCGHEYITNFSSLIDDYLEMDNVEKNEGTKWKRFETLNELLRGFRRGELTIFSGKTGTGKTTFLSEYSVDLCTQGVNTLWGSFEVRNDRLAIMQLKQFAAVNLDKEDLEKRKYWARRFEEALPMHYLTFHGAQEIEKVIGAMNHAVYIYDVAHVIIDNLQFMTGTASLKTLDRFYLQDLIIAQFRKFATEHNVHVTLVIHPRKENEEQLTANSIFGGAKATQEADNVVLLQEETVNQNFKKKFIQIVKNRFSGDLGSVPLFFNKGTLTFSKKIFQREKLAKKLDVPVIDYTLSSAHSDDDDAL